MWRFAKITAAYRSSRFDTTVSRVESALPFIARVTPLESALTRPLGSAGNKGLTAPKIFLHPLCYQHLRVWRVSVANKGLITLLESALTKNPAVTPLESALRKIRGVRGSSSKWVAFDSNIAFAHTGCPANFQTLTNCTDVY